jgi:hypothetical protein
MFGRLVMLLTASAVPQISASFFDPAAQREGIVAEQITLPETIPAATFADMLVAAEGLTSWNPQDPTSSLLEEGLQWRAEHCLLRPG